MLEDFNEVNFAYIYMHISIHIYSVAKKMLTRKNMLSKIDTSYQEIKMITCGSLVSHDS